MSTTSLTYLERVLPQILIMTLSLAMLGSLSEAANSSQPPTPTEASIGEVEAWAMLFQMMSRLDSAVAKHELTVIDPEDPVASAAVSSLLLDLDKNPSPKNGLLRVQWIRFVRGISALHSASDAGNPEQAEKLIKISDEAFRKLQEVTDPKVLQRAHELTERFTCAMHPEVIGAKGEACPKCGMPLDQPVVLLPSFLLPGKVAAHVVVATITTDSPLEPGKLAHMVLHLSRGANHPVTLDQLTETHTKKIHLLLIDQSLTDYHHEHPQPTGTDGDYSFEFTPTKPGAYLAWADVRPLPLGLQEYDKATIAGSANPEPITHKETRLSADSQGFHFDLTLGTSEITAGVPSGAKLRVTRGGKDFNQLEPVMGAFAHLVGFNEDRETIIHLHPTGAQVLQASDRDGPVLEFKIYATKPGFTRLFAQVQIDGRQVFAPFGLQVVK
jgi:hypothetical protein